MSQYRIYVHKKGKLEGARERGIYADKAGKLYLRQKLTANKDHYLSLGTDKINVALALKASRDKRKIEAELGIAENPERAKAKSKATVARVIQRYTDDGYPDRKGVRRSPGKHLDEEIDRCKILLEYFTGKAPAEDLDQNELDNYHTWRVERVEAGFLKKDGTRSKPRGGGHRATDLDLNCLNNCYRWALRKKLIRINPIASRARYRSASDATHCREYAPESAEELHAAAGMLFSSRRSEVLGWQLLIEGMTSLRSVEAVALRMDVRATEPGGLTPDKKNLCVRRAKKSKRHNPNVQVHQGLETVLAAHRIWHEARYPLSPWYLPGRRKAPPEAEENAEAVAFEPEELKHVDQSVLTKALDRLHRVYLRFREKEKDAAKVPEEPHLTRKYTSHGGGRAFYVYARRCQGIDDPQICYEINHTGGVGTLESVYALPAKHWQNGHAPGMDWLPKKKDDYAWNKIQGVDFSVLDKGQEAAPDFSI